MLVNGVDIIEISRVGDVAARYGQRFYRRIYTQGELDYCRGRAPQLASRFAAKEAVMKALGTGTRGVGWREIGVVREKGRAPTSRPTWSCGEDSTPRRSSTSNRQTTLSWARSSI